jgi:hypothetical protein
MLSAAHSPKAQLKVTADDFYKEGIIYGNRNHAVCPLRRFNSLLCLEKKQIT